MTNTFTMNNPKAWSFRVYLDTNSNKATHIVRDQNTVEAVLPRDRAVIVKLFCWRRLAETYLVSWMGDHYKWDPCYNESDR